ncbi:hypothetical protein [Streptomyces sp. NPDC088182]|uniref:hypothetical protein n=1 Tax=Streptomyces sp. NPDC088182 TaxID=3365838 RepID=UPI00381E1B63
MYARFLSATVSVAGLVEHGRLQQVRYRWLMSGRAINKFEDMSNASNVELLQAYMEILLVANPEPLREAEALMDAVGRLMSCVAPLNRERYDAAQREVGAAQRRMVDACRNDLWYLPRWWQAWRPAWWGARWRSIRGRKPIRLGTQSQ